MRFPDSQAAFLPGHFPTFHRALRETRHFFDWLNEDRTIKFLRQINADRERRVAASGGAELDSGWLLPHRERLRRIIARTRATSIKIYLRECPQEMIPICVWLWGECADRFRLRGLGSLRFDESSRVRRSVAKALWRLEAWSMLDEMAAADPEDVRVQWFAKAAKRRRHFRDRLKDYKEHLDASHAVEMAAPSTMPYWSLGNVWNYTPPKSVTLMRRLLHRIHRWVRWGVS